MSRFLAVLFVGLGLAVCCTSVATAQDAGADDLITDRPDFTESGVVVPKGSVQIEGGFTWDTSPGDIKTFAGPEALIRWGLHRMVELRVGLPDYANVSNHNSVSGLGDSSLGTKIELGPLGEVWDLAGIVTLSLPTGEDGFSSEEIDPTLIIVTGRSLDETWSMGAQLVLESATSGGDRDFFWGGTVVVSRPLGSEAATGAFLELAAVVPEKGTESIVLHHGYTHLLKEALQLDVHGGVGLTNAAPDLFIGAGVSFRP